MSPTQTERHDYYTDIEHITESVRALPETDTGESARLYVVETAARLVAADDEAVDDRNLRDYIEHVCHLDYDGTVLTLGFHQKLVDNPFTLDPASPRALAPHQASQPANLGETLERVVTPLEETFDITHWDFGGVEGESIAHGGHITDYEFEYEAFPTGV
jgi:hypothetical protein